MNQSVKLNKAGNLRGMHFSRKSPWTHEKRWQLWWFRKFTNLSYKELTEIFGVKSHNSIAYQLQRYGLTHHPPPEPRPEFLEDTCLGMLNDYKKSKL